MGSAQIAGRAQRKSGRVSLLSSPASSSPSWEQHCFESPNSRTSGVSNSPKLLRPSTASAKALPNPVSSCGARSMPCSSYHSSPFCEKAWKPSSSLVGSVLVSQLPRFLSLSFAAWRLVLSLDSSYTSTSSGCSDFRARLIAAQGRSICPHPILPNSVNLLPLLGCSWSLFKVSLALRGEQGESVKSSSSENKLITSQWNKAIGGDASETGSGPGSYDIRESVWHVNVSSLFTLSDTLP